MRPVVVLMLLALAACGADGAPEPREPREPGITVSGTVGIGVSGQF